ncbi:hypothetical protein AAY473_002484 [Plecturocebus cupreus]
MTPEEKDRFLIGKQAVPSMDPHWDPDSEEGDWSYSIEGQLILKDKFITPSAADIRRKLQKLALGPEQSLESLLNLATLVFYKRPGGTG